MFTKRSMWKDARPFIDNYVEDHVQAPYIIRRNYEKYLKDYEDFYHDGFGATKPGEYINEKICGAPIGKCLTKRILLINAKVAPATNLCDESKAQNRINGLVESVDTSTIFKELDEAELNNPKLKAFRKNYS